MDNMNKIDQGARDIMDAFDTMILNLSNIMDQVSPSDPNDDLNLMIKATHIKMLFDDISAREIYNILKQIDFKFPDSGN